MPRHPPCALTHLTTTRCSHPLCNTQHTTTPQPPHHHHTEPPHNRNPCVRQPRPEAAAREQHPQTGVSSGPNSVPSRPDTPAPEPSEQAAKCSTQPHPQNQHQPAPTCLIRCGIVKGGSPLPVGPPTHISETNSRIEHTINMMAP